MSALAGIRVVELAESVAGEYCGKLLADFGAEVIKVEPPGGSPTRAMAPLVGDDGPERSAVFAYLNTNKRSVVIAELDSLIATAAAVIGELSVSDLARRHPGVVFCSITPYGIDAPPELQNAQSLNVFHSSGWGFHTPSHADPARPPLKGPGRFLADYEAGLDAALCVASSLFRKLHTGAGEFIDVSAHAVLASRADCVLGRFVAGEISPANTRDDYDQQGPASFFACADGFVYLYMTSGSHWAGLKKLMGQPDWLDDFEDDWLEFSVTPKKVSRFQRGFADWVRDLNKDAVSDEAQRLGVPLVPVTGATDLKTSPQYRHRGFFHEITHPVLGTAAYPGVPYLLSRSPARITSPAPALGQDTDDIREHRPPKVVSAQLKTPRKRRGGPLEGVRVVELTKVWAGPYAGKLLAFLGAEVIKVESSTHPDEMRAYGGTDINHAPFFLSINPEVLSVELDLKSTQDIDRLRALISHSDVVINNLRPGAMERMGLGYDQLKMLKQDIISVSIKMWGNDGPMGYQTGYAPCFAALAGVASLVGYPGGPPLGTSMRYGDSTVGAAAAFATVAALLHRDLIGEGQFVDLSAVETLSSMIGDCLLAQELTGTPLRPDGNRHANMAPHNCYPCTGGDWVAIAVSDEAQWRELCQALDTAVLAEDPRFATLADRLVHVDALDVALAELTRDHDATELAHQLRAAGVPATKSATALDVISDPLLWDRDLYRFVSDHREGQRPVLAAPWRMSIADTDIARGAPDLGEQDDYVRNVILTEERRNA
ncbi:CoA-transferase [Mycobacterium sp. 1245111.1]|uniref:CaiB/BaiF CoA transferase family protein n=1 Tax=Mycobacterium sp. 1245111.1 TaxID=1834073 RepID=UPI0007FCE9DC|nr:CoA transferase [Mycobacterium sp. 1245111.1]OBK34930.1 CoA-transferase [Mycobacterium sp. 1245111.1]